MLGIRREYESITEIEEGPAKQVLPGFGSRRNFGDFGAISVSATDICVKHSWALDKRVVKR